MALTLTPALCSLLLARRELKPEDPPAVAWLKPRYVALLRRVESHPGLIGTAAFVVMTLGIGVLGLLSGTGEAKRTRLRERLGSVDDDIGKTAPDDLLIFAFSGHGFTNRQGEFYLLPSDSGTATPESEIDKLISSHDLTEWLRDVDAGENHVANRARMRPPEVRGHRQG